MVIHLSSAHCVSGTVSLGTVAMAHLFPLEPGVKLIFTGGHISLMVAFKGPNVILGLYKYNYPLTSGKDLGTAAR